MLKNLLTSLKKLFITLFQFNKLIVNDGHLIIAVPNHDSYDAKYYGKYWAGYDVPRHRYHFNKKAIVLAAKYAGFELLKSAPMFLDAFYVSILSEKYKNNPLGFFKGFLIISAPLYFNFEETVAIFKMLLINNEQFYLGLSFIENYKIFSIFILGVNYKLWV